MDDDSGNYGDARLKERLERYGHKEKEMVVKCLLSCVAWFPPEGKMSLTRDILDADTDETLYKVYKNLYTGLFTPMKATSALGSVSASPHPNRQKNVYRIAVPIDESQSRAATFRDHLLRRDGHRCVITKWVEKGYHQHAGYSRDVPQSRVEAAPIVPFAYGSWDGEAAHHYLAKRWEVLYRCFPSVRRTGLSAENINSPKNGLCLQSDLRHAFGQFSMAFKATGVKDQYELKVYRSANAEVDVIIGQTGMVTFKQATGYKDIPLPDADILECHYRLAEILNATGLGKEINWHFENWNRMRRAPEAGQLTEDGSTDLTSYLEAAFWWAASPASPVLSV
ncbi:hypothetical protein BO78DRAFT_320413 [Aspergillus sclerotiicarbonarius CBS 121057]|uniref:HNH nuclease domain-containing protein n=1 Tax=Aspergillus sclerotiicarbonarius (strain CBS 121057 / IBT 28362) TaxID=1448318 RepID=A0A319ED71_ASPSB|nr:hypothetical protein BO78DRAFT_320413 [Aspergillus sclerotiicarbonarius CBS 121057]